MSEKQKYLRITSVDNIREWRMVSFVCSFAVPFTKDLILFIAIFVCVSESPSSSSGLVYLLLIVKNCSEFMTA